MSHARRLTGCLAVLLFVNLAIAAEIAAEKETAFLRYVDDDAGGGTLQAEIVTFRNARGQTVDLLSAVHIADKGYYDALNARFDDYDAVLYEMVKPKDVEVPRPGQQGRTDHPIATIQRTLKNLLALDFQLDAIDYTRANFVHADLDAETFQRLQAERGESLLGMMLQQMLNEIVNPRTPTGKEPTLDELLKALTSPDRPRQLKLILAPQFHDMEAMVAGFEGPDGSVLVTERNKACIKVLEDRLKAGDRKLAIFFGAAHMPDLSKRLTDLGFQRTGSEWITAWDLTAPDAEKKPTPAQPKPEPKPELQPDPMHGIERI